MTALLREEGPMRMISRGLLASGLVMGALVVQGMPQAQAASLIVVERATTDHVTKVGPRTTMSATS